MILYIYEKIGLNRTAEGTHYWSWNNDLIRLSVVHVIEAIVLKTCFIPVVQDRDICFNKVKPYFLSLSSFK
jgi:hypothetical protein